MQVWLSADRRTYGPTFFFSVWVRGRRPSYHPSVMEIKLSGSEILFAQNTRAKPSDRGASKPLTRFDFIFFPRRRHFPRLSTPFGLITVARRSSCFRPRRLLRPPAGRSGAIDRGTRPRPATLRVVETGSSCVRQTQTGLHSSAQNIKVADSRALTGWRQAAGCGRCSGHRDSCRRAKHTNPTQSKTLLVFFLKTLHFSNYDVGNKYMFSLRWFFQTLTM